VKGAASYFIADDGVHEPSAPPPNPSAARSRVACVGHPLLLLPRPSNLRATNGAMPEEMSFAGLLITWAIPTGKRRNAECSPLTPCLYRACLSRPPPPPRFLGWSAFSGRISASRVGFSDRRQRQAL